jgi:hypothetical protein
MPVVTTPLDSAMVIRYQTGVSANGAPILRQKSLPIKASAADQDVFDVAAALFSLLQYPLAEVRRTKCDALINQ